MEASTLKSLGKIITFLRATIGPRIRGFEDLELGSKGDIEWLNVSLTYLRRPVAYAIPHSDGFLRPEPFGLSG